MRPAAGYLAVASASSHSDAMDLGEDHSLREDGDREKEMQLTLKRTESDGGDHHGQEHGHGTAALIPSLTPSLDGAIRLRPPGKGKPPANVKDMYLPPQRPSRSTVTTRQAGYITLPRLVDPLLPPSPRARLFWLGEF